MLKFFACLITYSKYFSNVKFTYKRIEIPTSKYITTGRIADDKTKFNNTIEIDERTATIVNGTRYYGIYIPVS